MDFRFSAEDERFRQEVRDFLKRDLPPDWLESGIDAESEAGPSPGEWRTKGRVRRGQGEVLASR